MKPRPSSSLLPPGYEWKVVESPGWTVATTTRKCRRDIGIDRVSHCGARAVAVQWLDEEKPLRDGLAFCGKHIGSHRWISRRTVQQWRAFPSSPNPGEAAAGSGRVTAAAPGGRS